MGGGPPPFKKTNAKFWCDHCRIYVYDNKISRTNHENSPPHKAALSRYVAAMQREEREKMQAARDFAIRTGAPLEASKSSKSMTQSTFYSQQTSKRALPVNLLSMKGPLAAPKRQNTNLNKLEDAFEKPFPTSNTIGSWQSIPNHSVATPAGEEQDWQYGKVPDGKVKMNPFLEPNSNDNQTKERGTINNETLSERVEVVCTGGKDSISRAAHPQSKEEEAVLPLVVEPEPIKIEFRKFTKPKSLRK